MKNFINTFKLLTCLLIITWCTEANCNTIDYNNKYLLKHYLKWNVLIERGLIADYVLFKKTNFLPSKSIQTSPLFVKGLSKATVYSKDEAEKGSVYNYLDGRSFKIEFSFYQLDVIFYSKNENNQRRMLDTKFDVGYNEDMLKESTKFLVGQYDFDPDDIDELVVALQDNEDGNNGLTINVFKLQNDEWVRIGDMTGEFILGEPIAEVKMNKITIKRNLREAYYQWTLESGKFKDTGDF